MLFVENQSLKAIWSNSLSASKGVRISPNRNLGKKYLSRALLSIIWYIDAFVVTRMLLSKKN